MNWPLASAILGGIVTIAVAVIGGLFTIRSANRANESSPYSELAKRVVALEISDRESSERIAQLRREVDRAKSDLRAVTHHSLVVQDWIDAGAKPPAPTVPEAVAALLHAVRDTVGHRALPEDA
jgi:hypothetical protein